LFPAPLHPRSLLSARIEGERQEFPQQYRAEGAPFGDDESGLYHWLTELLHEREV
jgi:hypothetical protein